VTNTELIEALRVFWPDNCQEAAAFLGALRECAEAMVENVTVHPDDWHRFVAVAEALDDDAPAATPDDKKSRLLVAAEQGGLTIASAAELLGVTRWQARQYLTEMRDVKLLRVHRQGRASRWVLDAE
jgi:hypothetical protein